MRKNLFSRKDIIAVRPDYFVSGKALGYYRSDIVGDVLIESAITWGGDDVTSLKTFDGKSIHSGCMFPTKQLSNKAIRKLAGLLTMQDIIGMSSVRHGQLGALIQCAINKMPTNKRCTYNLFRAMGDTAESAFQKCA